MLLRKIVALFLMVLITMPFYAGAKDKEYKKYEKEYEKLEREYIQEYPGKDCYKSVIVEPVPFSGDGGEVFVLDNGTTWKEVSYQYLFLLEFYPEVTVCPNTNKMYFKKYEFKIQRIYSR